MIQFFAAEPITITIPGIDPIINPEQDAIEAEKHRIEVEQAIAAANLIPLPDNLGQDVGVQG
jgi:hypothetical protein